MSEIVRGAVYGAQGKPSKQILLDKPMVGQVEVIILPIEDGTRCSVSGEPGRLGHGVDDRFWFCDDHLTPDQQAEPVGGPWKLWNGWGPANDGLMRVERIGPSLGGLEAFYNTHKTDIQATLENLRLVVNAVNLYLNPPSRKRDLQDFWHNELPDILAQVSAGLLDASMAHALIHKAILGAEDE